MKNKYLSSKSLLVLAFVLTCLFSYSQGWQWSKRAGSGGDNASNIFDREKITDLVIDKSGSIYAAGYFFNYTTLEDSAATGPYAPGFAMQDAFLIKYNACGSLLWYRRMGGMDDDEAHAVKLDSSGHVIVFGFCTASIYGVQEYFGDSVHDTLVNGSNAGAEFMARFDTSGRFIDVKNYSTIYGSVLTDSQNNYILTDGLTGIKVNPAGVPTYSYTFATPAPFYPDVTGICIDKSDNIYICGYFNNTVSIGPGTILSPTPSTVIPGINSNNSLIMKFSPAGNLLWYQRSNNTAFDVLNGVTADTSGTHVATGGLAFYGSTGLGNYSVVINGSPPLSPYNASIFYLLDAASGNLISAQTATAQYQGNLFPVATDRENNFLCIGGINGFLAFNTATYTSIGTPGGKQMCIGKFDAGGNFLGAHMLPKADGQYDELDALAINEQGNIYIGGMFSGILDSAGTSLYPNGEDGFVAVYGFGCHSDSASLKPYAPANLTASATAIPVNVVTWTDNSQFESGFELWAMGGNIPSYSLIATLAANTTTFTHTNLLPLTTYCYKARSVNAAGPSIFTNIGCATTPSAVVTGTMTGIASLSESATFHIYPNPTDGPLTLQFTARGEEMSIEVINQLGEVVSENRLSTLNGSNKRWMELPKTKGMYLIRLRSEAGVRIQKVVVN